MIGESLSASSILPILLRRKRHILLSGIATACVAFATVRVLPLRYASEGNLIIEHPSGEDAKNPTVLTSVLTQVDVLQSKELIRRSVQSLASTEGIVPTMRLPPEASDYMNAFRDRVTKLFQSDDRLESDPLTDKVNYVQEHLRVEAKDSSSVISVKFEAGSPQAAAAVVNALMATYVSAVGTARDVTFAKTDQWISQQMSANWQEVQAAEQRVAQFMKENPNLTEVQGSATANLQLSKDTAQLALAREDLARQQAALNTISRSGGAGAEETLNSKLIQSLKEIEAKTLEQINSFYESDPRRLALQNRLAGTRSLIKSESNAVVSSISRGVEIARARVQALEAAAQKETEAAQVSTVASITLKQLTSDLEAKRQLYVEFLKNAGQAQLGAVRAPSARILFPGVAPPKPVQSLGAVSLLLGFFSGIVGSAGIITIRTTLRKNITSTNEMTVVTGLPVFGSLPDLNFSRTGNMLIPQPQPIVTETFRGMWLAMRTQQNEGGSILVTSSEIGEGKTTMAAALARSFADDGFRVLLVDVDLRRPHVAKTFNLRPKRYLESVLDGTASLDDAVVHDAKSGLAWVLSNGSSKNPIKLLSSDQFKEFLHESRQSYDFVILDSAPVLHVADPILLAGLCQHIVFIVESGRVSSELVAAAIQRFAREDRDKIFTLLTRVRTGDLNKRDYYSGYANA
jgi:succinoglycan biosynthesis transport protein ExoP